MKKFVGLLAAASIFAVVVGRAASAQSILNSGAAGADISWPNCQAHIPDKIAFGVVGVNGGKGYTANNCLAAEAAHFKNLSLYVNTGYPGNDIARKYRFWPKNCGGNDGNCLAYNYGYNAGKYAADYALGQAVYAAAWWLDVETVNSWSDSFANNQQSLSGEIDALRDYAKAYTIGIYSTPEQWRKITGGWQNYLPNWAATGSPSLDTAKAFCRDHDITGGGTWLTQYIGATDRDYAC